MEWREEANSRKLKRGVGVSIYPYTRTPCNEESVYLQTLFEFKCYENNSFHFDVCK